MCFIEKSGSEGLDIEGQFQLAGNEGEGFESTVANDIKRLGGKWVCFRHVTIEKG